MKRILIILVLLLVGFSNSSFADKLPTSLFGISILEHYEEHLIENNDENKFMRGICIDAEKYRQSFHAADKCFKDFKRNESFANYSVFTDEQGIINFISGFRFIGVGYGSGYNTDVCYKEKTNLIEILSTLYGIDKNRFSQKYFKISWEGEEGKHIALYDKSFIKYNKGNDALVLDAECWYGDGGVNFMLKLLTEELFLKSIEDLIEIDSINLEVFNTDLSGY